MNGTAYNNTMQTLNIPYTLIQPVIPGRQLAYKTPEQLAIWHYEDFILDIMKVMDLQCIAHCTDDDYQLITIQGGDDTLIHIKPSKTLHQEKPNFLYRQYLILYRYYKSLYRHNRYL